VGGDSIFSISPFGLTGFEASPFGAITLSASLEAAFAKSSPIEGVPHVEAPRIPS